MYFAKSLIDEMGHYWKLSEIGIGQIILKVEKHLVNEITMPWLKPTIVTEWCELLGHKNGNGIKVCKL